MFIQGSSGVSLVLVRSLVRSEEVLVMFKDVSVSVVQKRFEGF